MLTTAGGSGHVGIFDGRSNRTERARFGAVASTCRVQAGVRRAGSRTFNDHTHFTIEWSIRLRTAHLSAPEQADLGPGTAQEIRR